MRKEYVKEKNENEKRQIGRKMKQCEETNLSENMGRKKVVKCGRKKDKKWKGRKLMERKLNDAEHG